jgi:transcriptional regulator with XRE-family HTH domain
VAATKPGNTHASWGRWLATQRKAQKLSQRKLAERSGGTVSSAQIQRWETGAEATVEDVINTCAALNIPVTEFLVSAGYLDPDQVGIPVLYRSVAGMPKRDLIALRRDLDDELDDRIPDDAVSGDHPAAAVSRLDEHRGDRRPPVWRPRGEEGEAWSAYDPQEPPEGRPQD